MLFLFVYIFKKNFIIKYFWSIMTRKPNMFANAKKIYRFSCFSCENYVRDNSNWYLIINDSNTLHKCTVVIF